MDVRQSGTAVDRVINLVLAVKMRAPKLSSAYPILSKPDEQNASLIVEQYILNKRGPKIEPWGTPNRTASESDKVPPIFTR